MKSAWRAPYNEPEFATGFNPLVVGAIYEICLKTVDSKLFVPDNKVSIPLWSGQYMKSIIREHQFRLCIQAVSIPLWSGQYMKYYTDTNGDVQTLAVSIPLWSGQYMKSRITLTHTTPETMRFNPLVVGAIYEIRLRRDGLFRAYPRWVSIPLWSGQYMKYKEREAYRKQLEKEEKDLGFNPLVVGAIYEIGPDGLSEEQQKQAVSIPLWSGQYMKFSQVDAIASGIPMGQVSIPLWSGQYMKFDRHLAHVGGHAGRFNPLVVGAIYEMTIYDLRLKLEAARKVSIPLWSGQYMKFAQSVELDQGIPC